MRVVTMALPSSSSVRGPNVSGFAGNPFHVSSFQFPTLKLETWNLKLLFFQLET
jgi:hypothetical protein